MGSSMVIELMTPEIEGCALIGDCGTAAPAQAARSARQPDRGVYALGGWRRLDLDR
jgi:hypothetical protein